MAVKSYALTTRQRLIDFLGLGTVSDTTKQNVLDRLIDAVTEFIENYCGKRFTQTAYTNEIYDGDGGQTIYLKNYPVSSTATFTIQRRNSALNEDDWETIDSQYYIVDYNSGIVKAMAGYKFPKGRGLIRISYTAGYNYDNAATFLSDTQAGDIEYAAWRLCAYAWNTRKGNPGVDSERIGDYAVTFRKTVMEDEDLKAILDKYAEMQVGGGLTPIQEFV